MEVNKNKKNDCASSVLWFGVRQWIPLPQFIWESIHPLKRTRYSRWNEGASLWAWGTTLLEKIYGKCEGTYKLLKTHANNYGMHYKEKAVMQDVDQE